MTRTGLARITAGFQGGLYISTGLWPLVHMASFLAVTGPKTDLWLVQAFGLIVAAVGSVLVYACVRGRIEQTLALIGLLLAATLAAIDFWYFAIGAIRWTYTIDGVVELAIVGAWLRHLTRPR